MSYFGMLNAQNFKNVKRAQACREFLKLIIALDGFKSFVHIFIIYAFCLIVDFLIQFAFFLGKAVVWIAPAASALLWNYLFIPPRMTFTIGELEDVLMSKLPGPKLGHLREK